MSDASCRSCGKSIVWAVFEESGKRSPFNAEPTLRGTWTLWRRGSEVVAKKLAREEAEANAELKRYVNHFATCAQAAQYRRAK